MAGGAQCGGPRELLLQGLAQNHRGTIECNRRAFSMSAPSHLMAVGTVIVMVVVVVIFGGRCGGAQRGEDEGPEECPHGDSEAHNFLHESCYEPL